MTAKNARIVLAGLVSVYGVVSAADKTGGIHLPTAVSAVLVAAAPLMLALQHYLSDPSTGTPPAPSSAVPDPTAPSQLADRSLDEIVRAEVAKTVGQHAAVVTAPAGSHPSVTVTTGDAAEPAVQPAPVPPPQEWSTMAAQAPVAPPAPNPAPPAPQ